MASLQQIISWFKEGLFPSEDQFRQTWLSFWHKSEKIPQSQIFGLQNSLDTLSTDMIYKVPVQNLADLQTTYPNPQKGWSVQVINKKNGDGNSFIYQWSGTQWNNTGMVGFPSDVVKHVELDEVKGDLAHLEAELENITNSLRPYNVTEEIPLPDGQYYTFDSAIAAVPEEIHEYGRVIVYQTDADTWESKRFISNNLDNWSYPNFWQDYGSVNETYLTQNITNAADEEDLTEDKTTNKLKFSNKSFNRSVFSGLGRRYLRKNIINNINILSQNDINSSNTIYIIQYDYDLNGETVTLPDNCTIKFEGGSISNGTITMNNGAIDSPLNKIFDNTIVIGAKKLCVEWFGAKGNGITDDTKAIQACTLNLGSTCIEFQTKKYVITDTIEITFHNIINANNCVFLAKGIRRKFALALMGTGDRTTALPNIVGGFTVINSAYDFTTIEQDVTFVAIDNITGTIEDINTGNVKYQDFNISGAIVGDMVRVIHEEIQAGYCLLSGEVIENGKVRIYANSKYFSSFNLIADISIKIAVYSGVCHGINVGGTITSPDLIRVINFTGVSFSVGSGMCMYTGIKNTVIAKLYYAYFKLNLVPAAGYGFCNSERNNCNKYHITAFLTRDAGYETDNIHTVICAGLNNDFELLSLENRSSEESLVLAGTGNTCRNVYVEATPKAVKSYIFSTANDFKFKIATSEMDYRTIKGNNYIERTPMYYVNGASFAQPRSSQNLLRNYSFKAGHRNWNNWGSNTNITVVEGALGLVLRCVAEEGRIIIAQNVTFNTPIKNIPITLCAFVRGNIRTGLVIYSGGVGFQNSNWTYTDEEFQYIESQLYLPMLAIVDNQIQIQICTETGVTGYIEIFNPCLVIGRNPLCADINETVNYTLNEGGTVFNEGNPIASSSTVYQDFPIEFIKSETICCFSLTHAVKEDFLNFFDIRYVVTDGNVRVYLTNRDTAAHYSGRVYFYIQY